MYLEYDMPIMGTGVMVHDSVGAGESLVPVGTKGVLSPFRATLELVMHVTAGGFSESVSLGIFDLVRIPSAYDTTATVAGVDVVVASRVQVEFRSLEERVRRRGFRSAEHPASLGSCWDEIRRITGMPVVETVEDKPIPWSPVDRKRGVGGKRG